MRWLILLLVAGASFANTYTTSFSGTENPISEGGNWINGKTTGLDWADVELTPGLAFGTETGFGGFDDSTAELTGFWGPDQMAQATVYTLYPTFVGEVELRLRTSISADSITGYEINFSSGYSQIVRWNGAFGDFTILASNTGVSVTKGDIVEATIVGSTITEDINGVQVNQVTDSTFETGSPGIGFYNGGGGTDSEYGFTTYTTTDLPEPSTLVLLMSGLAVGIKLRWKR